MITVKIRVDGKEYMAVFPSKWEEMTVKQYIQLADKSNGIEMLSALSGLDLWLFENTNIDLTEILGKMLKLLSEAPDMNNLVRDQIWIGGIGVGVTTAAEISFLQKEMIKMLAQNNDDLVKVIPDAFAVWITPDLNEGLFEAKKVPEVKKLVLDMPVMKVFPWVVFFLRQLRKERNNYLSASMRYQ